jgi:hypothetical protein
MVSLQLHVIAVEACNIPKTGFLTASDLYMTLQVSTACATQTTSVAEATQSPIWNEQFHFSVGDQSNLVLTVVVKSRSMVAEDRAVARLDVGLCDLPLYQRLDKWYDMQTIGEYRGEPSVRLIFQIAPPAHPAFQPKPATGFDRFRYGDPCNLTAQGAWIQNFASNPSRAFGP